MPDVEYYVDRIYQIVSAPEYLDGELLIKTANSDKSESDSPFLTFEVNEAVDVYVMYDWRSSISLWLTSWTKMTESLTVNDGINHLDIYKKIFSAGQVALGENGGAGAMYIVGIVPQSQTDIKTINSDHISVFPNPASDQITIDFGNTVVRQLKIFDMMGSLLEMVDVSTQQETIDLSAYHAGVYLLQIEGQESIFRKKIIKK